MSLTGERLGPRLRSTRVRGWCRPRGWRESGMSNAAENSGSVREVRIALVCYGGVSLAIYMHGVTRELHRLVVASSRFDEERNPFEPPSSEHVYWELLHELAAEDGVQTRVVVDVISGTSAGGINGVFLAKAIAHDLSQQSLRDLWFNEADIGKLLVGPRWLNGALSAMTPGSASPTAASDGSDRKSLVPRTGSMELFVTMTDARGHRRYIPVGT